MLKLFSLKDKKALITGASGGIGKELARVLVENDAEVCISGRNVEELNELKGSLGDKCHIVPCDLSNKNEISELFSKSEEVLGQIDILVNNAGITKDNIFLRMSDQEWEDVLNINLNSTFNILKLITKGMVKRKYGRIVCLSSIAGLGRRPNMITYGTSKAAVIALVRNLSAAVAPHIRINSVAPGLIETDMIESLDKKTRKNMIENTPLKRIGKPQDIANSVCYLLSDRSDYTTGQRLTMIRELTTQLFKVKKQLR